MKIIKKNLCWLIFFLIIIEFSCHKTQHKNTPSIEFIDALLKRDTLTLYKYLDTLSVRLIEKYSIPKIGGIDELHYDVVFSLFSFKQDTPIYRLTIIFPWEEVFSISLIPSKSKGKWQFPLSYYINNSEFKSISRGDIVYFYPQGVSYEDAESQVLHLERFKEELCSACKSCCSANLIYVYTPHIAPSLLFYGNSDRENEPFYTDGLCISDRPLDTLLFMHALLDRNKYLYPFVEGVYYFYYTNHESFGIDYGDWVKSEILTESFRLLGKNIIENIMFYKPISGPLGYILVDYLVKVRRLTKKEVFIKLFSLSSEEERIVKNRGDMKVFYEKHLGRFMNMSMDSLFAAVGHFILKNYRDVKVFQDTLQIIKDKDRNVTYVLTSLYKNGRNVSQKISFWIDSIGFFHKPYYTFLFVPLWLADSFKRYLTPANSYWVPSYEFKTEDEILKEVKNEYATFLVSDFIRTYSLQQKQLPLWFSLGIPKFILCRDNCQINLDKVLVLEKRNVATFYIDPMKRAFPQNAIELSYLMVRLANRLDEGCVLTLMEKSISNLNFSTTYKELLGHDIHKLIDRWKTFVEDSLYYKVSKK